MINGIGAYRHVALLWVFILSFDAYVMFDLWASRAQTKQQALHLATSYVRLAEEQASASFDRTSILLGQAATLLRPEELRQPFHLPPERRRAIEAGLLAMQANGRGIVSISMTDATGLVFANTVGAPPGNSLGDREYFLALRSQNSSAPVVSRAIKGRVSSKWGIQVARSLRGANGEFAGMVVANMGLNEYFQPFYQSLLLAPGAIISLRDLDNRLVVRYPDAEQAMGRSVMAEPVDAAFAAGQMEGTYRRISPVDGVARSNAFRKLPHYPLYAVVGLADRDTFADWQMGLNRAVVFMVLITVGGGLASAMLRRKQLLEREVLVNGDKLALALKAAHAGTWYWDPPSNRLEWSPELKGLYGADKKVGTLSDWLACLHPDDRQRAQDNLARAVDSGDTAYRSEYRVLGTGPGRERWFASIGSIAYDREGRASRAFGVTIDITAAKQAEAMLQVARDEALEAKAEAERASMSRSKFLAAASHDLRQPVQSLLLLIEVLKLRLSGTPMEQVTGLMETALDGLRLLLDSLLDISKLDGGFIAPALAEVELGPLLERLAEEYRVRAAERGLELRVVRTSLRLMSDATLLERVLRNLLENALRYTPSGKILLGCRRHGAIVRVEVLDTGIGIAPEHHEAVFEEFHQVGNAARDRSQGLGLGLAIVRRLAGLLGGSVHVHSALNRGARFTFSVPRQSQAACSLGFDPSA